MYHRGEDNCLHASKLKLPVILQKKKSQNFAFAFEHIWLHLKVPNLLFPPKFHLTALQIQPSYIKYFVKMPL